MEKDIKLSVILPVYNESKYIRTALESILYQNINFNLEIIIIDDHSTDNTVEIVQSYLSQFNNIKLIINEQNRGKGYSFMRAYEIAKGEYFHVLDGDDYFISYNKLQKQVDFLDTNPDHVAVAHNTLILHQDNSVSLISNMLSEKTYEYLDCIRHSFYLHTSAYMFRKIHSRLPDIFLEKCMRGDSAVFFYHVYHSKLKVKYFPDIASIYNFHGKGLWSGANKNEHQEILKSFFTTIKDKIIIDQTSIEYSIINDKLISLTKNQSSNQDNANPKYTLNELLDFCSLNAGKIYQETIYNLALKGIYSFSLIDQLCEAIGRIIKNNHNYYIAYKQYHKKKSAILVSGLVPNGGGVFKEIRELTSMLLEAGKTVEIYCSNIVKTPDQIFNKYFNHPNIHVIHVNPADTNIEQVDSLIVALHNSSPEHIYPFISHHDIVMNSVLQRGLGKIIILDFVFDHGLSLGITNSSIDRMIVKTESQSISLSNTLADEYTDMKSDILSLSKKEPRRNTNDQTPINDLLETDFYELKDTLNLFDSTSRSINGKHAFKLINAINSMRAKLRIRTRLKTLIYLLRQT